MSTWNHRVVDMTEENDEEPLFAITRKFFTNEGRQCLTGHGEPSLLCPKRWRGWLNGA
jgi:hypothetical protein